MSEKLLAEEHHSRWAETVLKAVADALEGKPVSDFMESFAVVRRAAELHAAEARCTALQQQLDEMTVAAKSFRHDASSERERRVAAQEAITNHWEPMVADLRGSITRLIAQWREEVFYYAAIENNGPISPHVRDAFLICADALEAALTPQGEAK